MGPSSSWPAWAPACAGEWPAEEPETDKATGARKHPGRRGRRLYLFDLVLAGLAVAGLAALGFGHRASPGPPVRAGGTLAGAPDAAAPDAAAPSPAPHARNEEPRTRAPSGRPWRLTIPAISVKTSIELLGVEPDGTLQVPTDADSAGWYRLGTKPGDPGAAVIVGHVDSQRGPAVFYRLGTLVPRDLIRVSWKRGASVFFRVYAVREYAKAEFPTALVYGPTRSPELRLVTCGGSFDSQTGHYLDNVVVFARRLQARG